MGGSCFDPDQEAALEICSKRFGTLSRTDVKRQKIDTYPAITQLRQYFDSEALVNKSPDNKPSIDKMRDVLKTDGAAAWLIHEAIARNNENDKRGSELPLLELAVALISA